MAISDNPTTNWPERLQLNDSEWKHCSVYTTMALDHGNIPATLHAIVLLLEEDRDKVNWDEVTNPLRLIIDKLTYEGD